MSSLPIPCPADLFRQSPVETGLAAATVLGTHYSAIFAKTVLPPLMAAVAQPAKLTNQVLRTLPTMAANGGLDIAQAIVDGLLTHLASMSSLVWQLSRFPERAVCNETRHRTPSSTLLTWPRPWLPLPITTPLQTRWWQASCSPS